MNDKSTAIVPISCIQFRLKGILFMLSFMMEQNAHYLMYGTFFQNANVVCTKHYGRMHKVHDVYGVPNIH
jgi:hypothetical protein